MPANKFSCRLSRSSAARLAWRSSNSAAAKLCARFGSRQSKAPALTRLSNWRRLKLLVSSRRRKIEQVPERAVALALGDEIRHRLRADPLDRGERVADRGAAGLRVGFDREGDLRAVDVGRQQLDAEPVEFRAEMRELVGVAEVERHRRGQELDRVVRLQIGGLIGDQRVGGGVRLVEAVAGELRHLVEDQLGARPLDAALGRARRRIAGAARPSPTGSSCPSRGATDRRCRANSRPAPARSA